MTYFFNSKSPERPTGKDSPDSIPPGFDSDPPSEPPGISDTSESEPEMADNSGKPAVEPVKALPTLPKPTSPTAKPVEPSTAHIDSEEERNGNYIYIRYIITPFI